MTDDSYHELVLSRIRDYVSGSILLGIQASRRANRAFHIGLFLPTSSEVLRARCASFLQPLMESEGLHAVRGADTRSLRANEGSVFFSGIVSVPWPGVDLDVLHVPRLDLLSANSRGGRKFVVLRFNHFLAVNETTWKRPLSFY